MNVDDLDIDLPGAYLPEPVLDADRISDDAREVLADLSPSPSVRRVRAFVDGDRGHRHVSLYDWPDVLCAAEGRLALVSWGTLGVTQYGFPDDAHGAANGRRDLAAAGEQDPYDVWRYSVIRRDHRPAERPDEYGRLPKREVAAALRDAAPVLVRRRVTQLPALERTRGHVDERARADGGEDRA